MRSFIQQFTLSFFKVITKFITFITRTTFRIRIGACDLSTKTAKISNLTCVKISTIIIIIPILVILLGVYLIFRRDSIEGVVPVAVFFIVFGVAFLLFSLYFNKYGSTRIYNALKDYGVKYVDNQKYQKGSFEFTYDSYGKDGTKYVLIDSDDYDFELHKTAINLAIDIDAESLQMIYEYLKSYSKETNQKSSVVIVKLNSKIELTYDYSNSVFKHTMYRVYDGSDEDPNEDYNKLYSYTQNLVKVT